MRDDNATNLVSLQFATLNEIFAELDARFDTVVLVTQGDWEGEQVVTRYRHSGEFTRRLGLCELVKANIVAAFNDDATDGEGPDV